MQVPDGWSIGHVSDLLTGLNSGVSVNAEDISAKKYEIGVLKVSSVSYGVFLPNENKRVIEAELNRVKESPRKGSILISRSNTESLVGASVYVHKDYPNLFLPDKLWQTIPIKGKNVDLKWLFYFLSSKPTRYRLSKLATGTSGSMKNITKDELLTLPIKIPPLPEQQKIAQILSTWDKAIAKLEALIAAKQKRKKALMQQLLTGKKRFSGFDGEWKKIELGKLLDYKQPTPFLVKSTKYSDEYATPVLTAGKTFILGRTNEDFGIYQENLPVIIFDDFTTASKFVNFPFKAKSSAMKILAAKEGISIKFVFEAMQILNHQIGGHQRHWISIYSNLIISLPRLEEQQKIASVLTVADTEIETHQNQLDALKQQKKGLMQQLLTGKKRVKLDS